MRRERVTFHSGAFEDARNAWEWYRKKSASAADGFWAELERAVSLLALSPSRWPRHTQGTRRYVMHRYPFCIVYRVLADDLVHVIAVAHGRRRPDYWRKRY